LILRRVRALACTRLEGWGRQPISGLPEIGIKCAQVGQTRLAMLRDAHLALRAGELLSMRPIESLIRKAPTSFPPSAAAPALAICSSSCEATPETPIAPTQSLPTITGTAP